MTTVAIAGAGGRLGRVVARAFLDNGDRVIAVTRSGTVPDELAGSEPRKADAMNRDELIRATEGAEVIFNALNPVYTDWPAMCMPMARNIIAAAQEHGATHLFPGNVYVFGSPLPAELSEETPFRPTSRKGGIRRDMEALFAAAAAEKGVQTIVLRAGDFFGGTGTGSWFDVSIAAKVEKGVFTWPGRADIVHEWAYLPDLAKAFVALAGKRDRLQAFEAFHFSGHAITGNAMKQAAEKAIARPLKLTTIPWWLVRTGGLVVAMWREIAEMAYLWNEPHRLVSDRLDDVIGPMNRTPLNQAVAQALADIGITTGIDKKAA